MNNDFKVTQRSGGEKANLSYADLRGADFSEVVKELLYNYMEIYPSYYFIPKHYHGLISPKSHLSFCEHYGGIARKTEIK